MKKHSLLEISLVKARAVIRVFSRKELDFLNGMRSAVLRNEGDSMPDARCWMVDGRGSDPANRYNFN